MKIAFVGKGGSGKSTITALFVHHLIKQKQQVLAVDADINQHLAEMIGAELKPELALYYGDNSRAIRTYLRGTNTRIESAKRFVKTTPPGQGSRLIRITKDDQLIKTYATSLAADGYFMHAGTYDKDGVGISCYHSNLAVFENILSHTITSADDWLVADMVAGTDAFAGALHVLFDAIFMVVEPTPESVAVFRQFLELAEKTDVDARVLAVGNKLIDDDDMAYLRQQLGLKLVAGIAHNNQLRKARQQGSGLASFAEHEQAQMATLMRIARQHRPNANDQLRKLQLLHQRFASQDFTIAKHGDISGQIDEAFVFSGAEQT